MRVQALILAALVLAAFYRYYMQYGKFGITERSNGRET